MKRSHLKYMVKDILSEIEHFDPITGDVAVGPRDRFEQEDNDLGIAGYPKAVIKPVKLDNANYFFIFSDSTLVHSRVLGYGKTKEEAIKDAQVKTSSLKEWQIGNEVLEFNIKKTYKEIDSMIRKMNLRQMEQVLDYLKKNRFTK